MLKETNMNISLSRLKECREKNNLSKRKAANLIGVSQPAYLRYESGERTPSAQVMKEIAKVFHTSVDYLSGVSNDSSCDIIEVSKSENKEIFYLVEKCNSMTDIQLKCLITYAKKICDKNHNN